MNRLDLYQKTKDILLSAFYNDTLERRDYCGCAIGNLIAAYKGEKPVLIRHKDLSHLRYGIRNIPD